MNRLCSADDCNKPALTRGLCNAHYLRAWRHGSPYAGGTSKGAAPEFLNRALAYEGSECLTWPFSTVNGYGQIRIDGRSQLVSRIVCEAENGPAPTENMEAAHSCGNGHLGCVARKHLRWATRAENRQDMIDHGRSIRGEKNHFAKLTEADVRDIKRSYAFKTNRAIASEYGVDASLISKINSGHAWAWVEA